MRRRTCSIGHHRCFARWPGSHCTSSATLWLQRPGSEQITHLAWWQINQTWFLGWDGHKRTTTPPGPKVNTALLALIRVTKGCGSHLPPLPVAVGWNPEPAGLVKEKTLTKTLFSCHQVQGEASCRRRGLFSRSTPLVASLVSTWKDLEEVVYYECEMCIDVPLHVFAVKTKLRKKSTDTIWPMAELTRVWDQRS